MGLYSNGDVWSDNFDDNSFDVSYSTSGGVAETNQQIEVTVVTGGTDEVVASMAGQTDIWASIKVYVDAITAWPNAQDSVILKLRDSGNNTIAVRLRYTTANGYHWRLSWQDDALSVTHESITGTNWTTGQWYEVCFHGKAATGVGQNDGIIELWIDGTKIVDISNADTDTWSFDSWKIGAVAASVGITADYYLDDLDLGTEGYWELTATDSVTLGEERIVSLPGFVYNINISDNIGVGEYVNLAGAAQSDRNVTVSDGITVGEACAAGRDFHVDYTTGDDSDTGGINDPWQNMAKVNGETFTPGDRVLFKRNEEWNGLALNPDHSGNATANIVYGAYGSGDRPLLNGAIHLSGWTAEGTPNVWQKTGVTTDPREGVWMDGTRGDEKGSIGGLSNEYDFFYGAGANTLYIYAATDPDVRYGGSGVEAAKANHTVHLDAGYITLQYLQIEKPRWNGVHADEFTQATHVIVEECFVHECQERGIVSTPIPAAFFNDNWIVRNNEIAWCWLKGMGHVGRGNNWIVEDNLIHDCGDYPGKDGGGIKFNSWYTLDCNNHLIQRNIIYNIGTDDAPNAAIWLDNTVYNCILRYNLIYTIERDGILIESCSFNETYHNLISDCGEFGIGVVVNGSAIPGYNSEGNEIYCNVVYGNRKRRGGISVHKWTTDDLGGSFCSDNIVKNNIIFDCPEALECYYGGDNDGTQGSGNVYEYNCFGPEAVDFIQWGITTRYSTYAAWEAAYGGDSHSVEVDPEMEDPGNRDFHLKSTSPCIDAGTDVGLTTDYDGNTIPFNVTPDIGAFEYQGAFLSASVSDNLTLVEFVGGDIGTLDVSVASGVTVGESVGISFTTLLDAEINVSDNVTLGEVVNAEVQDYPDRTVSVADNINVCDKAALWGWDSVAARHVTSPVVLVDVYWASGVRKYSIDYVRTPCGQYKGNIISLPSISSSVGDIRRTFERANIQIVFSDTDYEFRTLEDELSPGMKNTLVHIRVAFTDDNYATDLTIWKGQIYDWRRPDNLQFQIDIEQPSKNIENKYPDKVVQTSDYPRADSAAVGIVIPVPYGTISNFGDTNDGAFPTLFVDTEVDAEKHLVGRQTAAITVDRVYIGEVLKELTTDYTISTQAIDGKTHTEIHWEAGVNPTNGVDDKVTCDITFGSRAPVEGIRHFLENFCGYADADFRESSYDTARTKEDERGYGFDGALYTEDTLRTHEDKWREEFELDIYWNKSGEICFRYISAVVSAGASHYVDYLHVLTGFDDDPQTREIVNYLTYSYNYDYARLYYHNREVEEDTASQIKHGGEFRDAVTFRWIRSGTVAADIAGRKVVRFREPINFTTLMLPLLSFDEELTEALKLTHFEGYGATGYNETVMQIRKTALDLNRFINRILVEDTSDFMGIFCRLGDRTTLAATWTGASSADQEYFYLCGESSGEFSNGDAGKQLFD